MRLKLGVFSDANVLNYKPQVKVMVPLKLGIEVVYVIQYYEQLLNNGKSILYFKRKAIVYKVGYCNVPSLYTDFDPTPV